ncbi:hypothetical protein Xvtf_16935 [Xanthomonas campestris pv. vitistrifoliae]|nr:hypothetical protein Xvtf_16935 [Xanthomonas campestris pv. vitistrifoliae]
MIMEVAEVPGAMLGGGCMRTRARVRIHTSEMRKMQNAQNAEGMRAQLPFPRRDIVPFIGEQGARRADEGGCEA